MKLSTRTDLDLSAEALFAALTDERYFEQIARRNGVTVTRHGPEPQMGPGSGWEITFPHRGKTRRLTSALKRIEPPHTLEFSGESSGFDLALDMRLLPMSADSTRIIAAIDIRPRTFGARIILQTLKIGKGRLESRFNARLRALGRALQAKVGAETRQA
ncbi:MAG: hypothetical protein WBA91_12180 [Paracoccaceae bacterium]